MEFRGQCQRHAVLEIVAQRRHAVHAIACSTLKNDRFLPPCHGRMVNVLARYHYLLITKRNHS